MVEPPTSSAPRSVSPLLGGSITSLRIVDRAAHLFRDHGRALYSLTLPSSAPLALAIVALYYLERVHGVGSLRLPFAIAFAASLALRTLGAGRVAAYVHALALGEQATADEARAAIAGRRVPLATAGVVGSLLDLPLVLFAAWMVRAGPLAIAFLLPVAGLRWLGSTPTLATRVALGRDGVARAWRKAWGDVAGARGKAFVVETLLWAVAALVLTNGTIALAALAMLGGALFGLDVAFAATFLSPENGFAVVLLLALALLALEPLRMTASTLVYLDARIRHEALDLRQRVDSVTAGAGTRSISDAAAVLLLAIGIAAPGVASAQSVDEPDLGLRPAVPIDLEPLPPGAPLAPDGSEARAAAERILSADEFRPVPQPGEGHFGDWLREVIERLLELITPDPEGLLGGPTFALPGMDVFLVVGIVLLLAGLSFVAWVTLSGRRKRAPLQAAATEAAAVDPRERDPEDILAEAEAKRRSGELREALRILYLATLVRLDRFRRISFDPSLTNWQYLRFFPRGPDRDRFAELTDLFDHKWYGHEPISDDDYLNARTRARVLTGEADAT
ncbi:MAG: DUF4129 domain-containing protein [Deltaproteobacteria bacterium]|nr:DUF4129 domain-containing protein [Deltaproteobacteria bacterium]